MEEHVVWSGKGTVLEVRIHQYCTYCIHVYSKKNEIFLCKKEKNKSALKRLREIETGVNKTVKEFT
jgi:hypothetical protein